MMDRMRSGVRTLAIALALGALGGGCGDRAHPAPVVAPATALGAEAGKLAPVVESVRIDPAEPSRGSTVRAAVQARNPDGRHVTLAYHWFVNGGAVGTGTPSLSLEGVDKGAEIRVSVTASDGALESAPVEATTRIIDRPPSLSRVMLSPKDSVVRGQPVTVNVSAVDPDGDPLHYEYTWYVNGERTAESGGMLPTDHLKKGDSIYAEVRATDGTNWSSSGRSTSVMVGGGPPDITSTPPGFRDDGAFRYQVTAVGERPLHYSLGQGPEGMAIDALSGELVWRPPANQKPGLYPVQVVVRDPAGLETKQSFPVSVQPRERKPTVAEPQKQKPASAELAPSENERKQKPADLSPVSETGE